MMEKTKALLEYLKEIRKFQEQDGDFLLSEISIFFSGGLQQVWIYYPARASLCACSSGLRFFLLLIDDSIRKLKTRLALLGEGLKRAQNKLDKLKKNGVPRIIFGSKALYRQKDKEDINKKTLDKSVKLNINGDSGSLFGDRNPQPTQVGRGCSNRQHYPT